MAGNNLDVNYIGSGLGPEPATTTQSPLASQYGATLPTTPSRKGQGITAFHIPFTGFPQKPHGHAGTSAFFQSPNIHVASDVTEPVDLGCTYGPWF
ncbi:hypothetical protein C0995_009828 [Termitomyces sp. Mi166|nr:hypothetical protein C0995_009828 [Termitomyces sp. Mi166\